LHHPAEAAPPFAVFEGGHHGRCSAELFHAVRVMPILHAGELAGQVYRRDCRLSVLGSMMTCMSFSETIFLFFLALIIFGPKKLAGDRPPGRQVHERVQAGVERVQAQIEQEISQLEMREEAAGFAPQSSARLHHQPHLDEYSCGESSPATLASLER